LAILAEYSVIVKIFFTISDLAALRDGFDLAGFKGCRRRRPLGKVCGATSTNPYETIPKIKSEKALDAALQHSHIITQPRPAFSRAPAFWGSKPR
jgi:hypothetical protein